MVCFNLAGGTGSGIAVDLARHLAYEKLGGKIPVIGVGQLPHSGDGDSPASLYASLNELSCMSDDANNADVTNGMGEDTAIHLKVVFSSPIQSIHGNVLPPIPTQEYLPYVTNSVRK